MLSARYASLIISITAFLPQAASATPLNISSFSSLGAFPTQSGTYTISYDVNTSAVKLIGPGTSITGTQFNSIAVFTFNDISIPAGMGIYRGNWQSPVAFLSKTSLTVGGVIDFRGSDGLQGVSVLNTSGTAGPGGGTGGYGGNGSGFGSVVGGGGGGGYGGSGGRGGQTPFGSVYYGGGGNSFGNLATTLQGGGNGGLGGHVLANIYNGAGGGGGGGALELGALGALSISGQGVIASGGNGGKGSVNSSQPAGGGGGGAGGGLLIHADSVSLLSSLDVRGGAGGQSRDDSRAGGGGGGGGRVYVEYVSGFTGAGNVLLSGGLGSGDALSGSAGVLVAVPEPSTCAMALAGLACGGFATWRRRRAAGQ